MDTISSEKISEQMAERLGISALPQKQQEEVADKVTEALLKTIFVETVEHLSQKERDEMSDLMDNDESTPQQMEEFLRDKIDDYDTFLQNIIDNFLNELLEKTK